MGQDTKLCGTRYVAFTAFVYHAISVKKESCALVLPTALGPQISEQLLALWGGGNPKQPLLGYSEHYVSKGDVQFLNSRGRICWRRQQSID